MAPLLAKLPRRRVSVPLATITAALLMLGLRQWSKMPQKLVEFRQRESTTKYIGVLDGTLYTREEHGDARHIELTIQAKRPPGGPWRTVAQDPTLPLPVTGVALHSNGIFYRFQEQPSGDRPAGMSGYWKGVPWLPVRIYPPAPRVRMRWALLTGGRCREVAEQACAADMWVSGDFCYWIRSELTGRTEPLTLPDAASPKTELLVTPLRGGPSRLIARLGTYRAITPCGDGLHWITSTDREQVLVHTRPPDFSLMTIAPYRALQPPVESGERLYWLESSNGASPSRLMTARRDGSETRVLLDVNPSMTSGRYLTALTSNERQVFFAIAGPVKSPDARPSPFQFTLGRLRPEQPQHYDTLVSQASGELGNVILDNEYLYFSRDELHENLFDWSVSGLSPKKMLVIYRVPNSG